MATEVRFNLYPCQDYLESEYARQGSWDESSQLWLIEPISRVEELSQIEFLQIGRPGVDGIGFGYRRGKVGLWAYYPLSDEFVSVATTVESLIRRWQSGEIKV